MAWRLQYMGFLLINLTLLERFSATVKGECSYTLEVKTSGGFHLDPGTKDHVRVRFGDKNRRELIDHYLSDPFEGNKEQPFKYDKTAKFMISGTCLESDVCSLHFKVEGTDNWKPDHAVVYTNETNYEFHFDSYLPENSWHGIDYCELNEQLASVQSQESKYKKTENKPCKKKGRKC